MWRIGQAHGCHNKISRSLNCLWIGAPHSVWDIGKSRHIKLSRLIMKSWFHRITSFFAVHRLAGLVVLLNGEDDEMVKLSFELYDMDKSGYVLLYTVLLASYWSLFITPGPYAMKVFISIAISRRTEQSKVNRKWWNDWWSATMVCWEKYGTTQAEIQTVFYINVHNMG